MSALAEETLSTYAEVLAMRERLAPFYEFDDAGNEIEAGWESDTWQDDYSEEREA